MVTRHSQREATPAVRTRSRAGRRDAGAAGRAQVVGAAAALATTVAVLTGCGGGAGSAAMPSANPRQLSGAVVDFFLPATGQQLTTGLDFFGSESRLENAMAFRCMADHDFGPKAAPMIRYTELYINPLQGSPQAAGWQGENMSGVPNLYNLRALKHGGLLAEVLTGSPNAPAAPAAEANAVYMYYTRCQERAGAMFAQVATAGAALAARWARAVMAVQASSGVRAAFSRFDACARRVGAPASAASSPDGFRDWLADLVSPPMPDPYGRKGLILSELRADRRWTAVFIACAGPVIPLEDRLQVAAQNAFMLAHYGQVLALKQLASRLLWALTRHYDPARDS
jgi:hypothetical protein